MFSPIKLLPMLSHSTKITLSTKILLWGCVFLHPNKYRHAHKLNTLMVTHAEHANRIQVEYASLKTKNENKKKALRQTKINARKVELVIVISITVERSKWTDEQTNEKYAWYTCMITSWGLWFRCAFLFFFLDSVDQHKHTTMFVI